jgi:hypothetical protein
MTIDKLQNILRFQSEQRKMVDEWGQKHSFWLKALRIDAVTAHNFFKKEIDEFAKDISSFFKTHITVLCIFLASIALLLIFLISYLSFPKNTVLMLIGLIVQALGGGYIIYGFIFPIKGLRPHNGANTISRGSINMGVYIDPANVNKAFKDIVELINKNAKARQKFEIAFSKDQIIKSKLELRKLIAQAVGFFVMVLGISLQILGLII